MKRFLSVLFISSIVSVSYAQTKAQIASRYDRSWYGEELFIRNIMYGSVNPISILYIPYERLVDFQVSTAFDKGNFRPIDGAEDSKKYNVNIYGLKKTDKVVFEGNIEYHNNQLNDMRWNGTVLTSERNPFIIADSLRYDSLTNNVDRESFVLNGGFAFSASDKITVGLRARYSAASRADQADPRIEAHGSRTSINPGLELKVSSKHSLGLSLSAELFHENVSSKVKDNMIPDHNIIFIFRELGKYDGKDGNGYSRYYNGKFFRGSLQSIYKDSRIQNYSEISFSMNSENAVDGGTAYSYKGGDFKETGFAVKDRFQIYGNAFIHNIGITAGFNSGSGKWHKQRERYDSQNNIIWDVLSSEITHKRKDVNAEISYRIDAQGSYPGLSCRINAGYNKVKINEYPDDYFLKYSTANTDLTVTKRWLTKDYRYSFSAVGSYRKALKPLEYEIVLTKPAEQRLMSSYTLPKYSYDASDVFSVSIKGDIARKLLVNDNTVFVKLSVGFNYAQYNGDYIKLKDTDRTEATSCLSLIF